MKLFKKQTLLFFTLLSAFCLPLVVKQNIKSVEEELPAVAPYNPNMHAYPCYSFETEPNYSTQNDWTFEAMSLGSITSKYTGKNVKLAIIDSGINYNHEDFKNSGVNVVDSHSMSIEWVNNTWTRYIKSNGYESHLNDTNGHGTNVAACVASQINGVGGSGIAPDVDLYIFNVQGYQWGAIQTALNECVSLSVDIVNMSIQAYEHSGEGYDGGYDPDSVYGLQSHIDNCYNHGITVVAAAGNYNTEEPSYPASYNHVISVGSLAKSSKTTKASYSNLYDIDVVTSGSVYVAGINNSSHYKETQGTSFSSPLVAAAIALYKEKYPSASPSTIENALKNSCDKISGNPTWAGSGRINIERFLNEDYSLDFTNVEDEFEISVGDSFQLEWAFTPDTISNKNVHFENLDDDVLIVSDTGLITPISEGETIVEIYSDENYNYKDEVIISVINTGPTPTVSSVTVTPSNLTLPISSTSNLSAVVNGDNNPSQIVTWSSDNTSVATVNSSGVVTAVATGNATIKATSQLDNSKWGTCIVTVTGGATDSTQYSLVTSSSDLEVGKSYLITNGTSGTIKAMSNASSNNNRPAVDLTVSSSKLTRGSNALSLTLGGSTGAYTFKTENYGGTAGYLNATDTTGNNYLRVISSLDNYAYFNISFSNSAAVITCTGKSSRNILKYNSSSTIFSCYSSGQSSIYLWKEVTTKTLSSISINTHPDKIQYEEGDYFDPTGLIITRTYSDSTTDTYTYSGHSSDFTFSPTTSTALTTSNTSVTISYGGKSCSQAITVTEAKTLSSISLSGNYQTSFVEGDSFVFGGIVTANYSDNSHIDVTSSATFTGYNMTVTGNQTVNVSYIYKNVEKTQSYNINVDLGTLSSISLDGQTTVYQKNAEFSFDGICTAIFENGYQKVVTPTSVSSIDMSSGGNKTVTISYTYNNKTVFASYEITVNDYRVVMEAETIEGNISWPSSATALISGSITGLNATTSGKTVYESSSMRLGTGSGGGTLNISASIAISSLKISAKYYSSSYSSSRLNVDGQIVDNLSSNYADYIVTLSSAKTSFSISTSDSNNRVNIQSVTIYAKGEEVDIGQTEDCVGLETFINTYMHMDYVDNLGYCSDSTHHYYVSAKESFNSLNDHQRTLFTSNSAYLLEWTRLSTWASKNGDFLNASILLSKGMANNIIINSDQSISILIIIISIGISIVSLGYFVIKSKKH